MNNVRHLHETKPEPAKGEADASAPAGDQARGRRAVSPWQIPWKGWKDILIRTYRQVGEDRLLAVAAGVVFYGLLALFPAITALVSSYALFAKASTISDHMTMLAGILPEGALGIVKDQVDRVLAKGDVKLGLAFALSFLLAVWSANGGIKAIIDALNVVYDEDEKRGFFKLNAVSLALTFGGLLGVLLAIGSVIALPIVLSTIGLGAVTDALFRFGRWPVLVLTMLVGLAVLYRFGPSRRSAQWRWLSVGSVFATLTWLAGSALLSFYLANYANYDATYGSLGAAIGLMMWMWMSTIVVLLGAELNAEIEHQTAADSTEGGNKPLGRRGAKMADTIGEAKS
ncbi:YihY/virulence factor BrkB family protein [Bradyrhizobium archetypum]|uniref:YihY/virulence factor BrkB family protein n=1 Tax=Bradyrhizobium archetypum TaxID=2721160 RepID=A0A7Y4H0G0_9BRAD|nr:YihY/virulence factor BrkB family protein [Bradyrhizobium archetypum]NOJ45306.1 YihY/virulence factor BrkB family protein [Bradyrhizobium archetypum]